MRLLCPEILYMLRHRPIVLSSGGAFLAEPSDKRRVAALSPLLPLIHRAEKFIFDSGSDQDERTVMAVRQTAVNMQEAGLFHLPHKITWIEDPYEDAPDEKRNFYLATEDDSIIRMYVATYLDQRLMAESWGAVVGGNTSNLIFHATPLVIDLTTPSDDFAIIAPSLADVLIRQIFQEAMYSFKKFIVTLNTENLQIERVRSPVKGTRQGSRFRHYEHRIIRVPLDTSPQTGDQGNGTSGKPRRRHLVRGYVFGKNTRPKEQQRWIKPYWRGDAEIGIVERDHYEIGR